MEIEGKPTPAATIKWFLDFYYVTSFVNLKGLDTSRVTNMEYMFEDCGILEGLDLSSFDLSGVEEYRLDVLWLRKPEGRPGHTI